MSAQVKLSTNIKKFLNTNRDLINRYRHLFPQEMLTPVSTKEAYDQWKTSRKQADATAKNQVKLDLLAENLDASSVPVARKDMTVPKLKAELEKRNVGQITALSNLAEASRVRPSDNFSVNVGITNVQQSMGLVSVSTLAQPEGQEKLNSIPDFVRFAQGSILKILQGEIRKHRGITASMRICITMEKSIGAVADPNSDGFIDGIITEDIYIAGGKNHQLLDATSASVKEFIDGAVRAFQANLDTFLQNGSDWNVVEIKFATISTHAFNPLRGSRYIEAPQPYRNSHCVINIKNDDDKCFLWSVLAKLHPCKVNPNRVSNYEPYECQYDLKGIRFPIACSDKSQIRQMEQRLGVGINIYGAGVRTNDIKVKVNPHPLYRTQRRDVAPERMVHLLYIEYGDLQAERVANDEIAVEGAIAKTYKRLSVVDLLTPLTPVVAQDQGSLDECKEGMDYGVGGTVIEEEDAKNDDDDDDDTSEASQEDTLTNIRNLRSRGHYALITDFDSLMFGYNESNRSKLFCHHCFSHYPNTPAGIKRRNDHVSDGLCLKHDVVKVVLPKSGKNVVKFKHHKNQQKCPYIIYADFEANISPTGETTGRIGSHNSISFGLMLCSIDPAFKPVFQMKRRTLTQTDEEWNRSFMDELVKLEFQVKDFMEKKKPLNLTPQEEKDFHNATTCHICDGALEYGTIKEEKEELKRRQAYDATARLPPQGECRVRDHDHVIGNFRGATHSRCNLNYNTANYTVPVVFHNLKGYDSHLIIKNLSDEARKRSISVIASNHEKFMSFKIGSLKFIDSYAFLSSSLAQLIKNKQSKRSDPINAFPLLKAQFPQASQLQLDLLLQKGEYPYEYMDSLARFEETQLPPKECFFSKLSGDHISDSAYAHAQTVWSAFNIKNLGEYHDLYLKTDVLFLADIFEAFRSLCLAPNGHQARIDPAWYISLPSFAWDCALKQTGIELELFTEDQSDMYHLFEDSIRGGVSMMTERHAKANNRYMKSYDPQLAESYITYLDANNLYGKAMSLPLPTGGFQQIDPTPWTSSKISSTSSTAPTGYVFQVDLDYPAHLHNLHNDLPFCVSKQSAPYTSPAFQNMLQQTGSTYKPTDKLIGTLSSKKKYTLHLVALKQALSHGLVLTKVHQVISFQQSAWLAPYIQGNTDLRAKATNDFEKDFYKLMNNAVFGKTMEQVRNHMDYKVVMKVDSARRYLSRPTFKSATIIREGDDGILGIELSKEEVELNKPIFVGFTILELSKVHMYDFHYNVIKKRYSDSGAGKATLLMTDTDSLVYHIQTPDLYTDMLEFKDQLDTSEYPPNHPLYSTTNKKVIGMFKDEVKGKIISEFVGLRAKMYSFQMDHDHEEQHQKAKGISRSVVKKKLRHQQYLDCLDSFKGEAVSINSLRSFNHEVYSLVQSKAGLSAIDDKRYIREDGRKTYAYGHQDIPQQ